MLEWKIEIIGYKDETILEDKWSRHYERLYRTCEKRTKMLQILYLHTKILMKLLVKDIFIGKH